MMSRTFPRFRLPALISMVCGLAAAPAQAFLINFPPPTVTVAEFRNVHLNHYFLSANPEEQALIDAGAAGPGWTRTGYGFTAYANTNGPCGGCLAVSRFYGTPGLGPNSHFYTAEAAEAEGLKRPGSGWTLESIEFAIAVPEGGACASGVPVYRLYNNRFMFNDSNHRYVTSAAERSAMHAQGWIDEGAHFCATGTAEVPIKTFKVSIPLDWKIKPSAVCENEAFNLGSCLAVNNLPVPDQALGPYPYAATRRLFTRSTGLDTDRVYAPSWQSPEVAARGVFVHGDEFIVGLHIDSSAKGPPIWSSINPLYQFRTTVAPGAADTRFFPWATGEFVTQLSVTASVLVSRIELRDPDSHAYGHPTLEFIDQRSGHHLYFTMLAYGTVEGADFVAPDLSTGKVIVSTTFRESSPFARSFGSHALSTPSGTDAALRSNGQYGIFELRVDRAEFQRIVDAARQADPALSANPADYLVDNFHFTNEVVGNGQIGMWIHNFALRVMRR